MGIVSLCRNASAVVLCIATVSEAPAALELGLEDASGSWAGFLENVKLGAAVRGVGDVDGDGYGDVLVGSYLSGVPTSNDQLVMRLLMGGGPLASDVPIADAATASFLSTAFLIHCARGGDIDNDGVDDLLMAADGPTPRAYAVFGRSDRSWGFEFPLDTQADIKATSFSDVQHSRVSGDVDFNGDGIDDFFIRDATDSRGYHGGQPPPYSWSFSLTGSPLGTSTQWSFAVGDFDGNGMADIAASDLNGQFAMYVRLSGKYLNLGGWSNTVLGNSAGYMARERGDFDGDGFDDILFGKFAGSNGLIFGQATIPTDMAPGPPLAHTSWTDGDASRKLGYGVQWLGDINGDGYDDFIAWQGPQTDPSGGLTANDHAYVVLGSAQRPTDPQAIEDAAIRIGPFQGFVWLREFVSATDWNGDGLMDILVGAGGEENGDIPNAGKVFIYLAGDYPAATWFNHVQRDIPAPTPGLDFGPTRVVATVSDNVTPRKLRVAYTDRAPAVGALDRIWNLELDGAPLSLLGFGYTDAQVADAGVEEADLKLVNAPSENGPWTPVAANHGFGANFFDLAPPPSELGPWWAIADLEPAPEHWIVE